MYNYLIEHEREKGFYKHPNLIDVYVSKDGCVYDNRYQKLFKLKNNCGYLTVPELGHKSVHKLVCETFLKIPENLIGTNYICNHLNGNKQDNRLENLEWNSFSGNSLHAYRTGLRTDNTPILIKDLRSGEIVRHYSLQEAARVHKVNGANISWYLKPKTIGNVFQKYYVIIREGMDWPLTGPESINAQKPGLAREILLFDKKNEQVIIFRTAKCAGDFIGIQENTLSMRLRRAISKGLYCYSDNDFDIWFLDMYNKDIPVNVKHGVVNNKHSVIKKQPRKPIPIIVTDLENNSQEEYISSEVYARKLGVSKNTFQKHIYVNNGIWKSRYRVHYIRT